MIRVASRVVGAEGSGQDRVGVKHTGVGTLLALADGAGNTRAGGLAAAGFVSYLEERADRLLAPIDLVALETTLRAVDLMMNRAGRFGETTGVGVLVRDGVIAGASVGDSAAWLISPDSFVDLTHDQVRKPLLGSASTQPRAFGPLRLTGRLLLASDGLVKYVSHNRLLAMVRSGTLEAAVERLITAPRLSSGSYPDDVAVILCEDA